MKLFNFGTLTGALLVLAVAGVTGCGGNLGAPYTPAAASTNRGVVYVYRPAQHTGRAVTFKVVIADEDETPPDPGTVVGFLEDDGYVPLTATGKTRISFPYAKKSVELDVAPGRSYYVRIAHAPSMFDPPENGTIQVVDEATASREIADTKIQEKTYRGK